MPLQKVVLDTPEEIDTGQAKLDITKDVVAALATRGLPLAGPPSNGFHGDMPSLITSLDDEKLGDLLNNLSRWCGYIDEELSKAETFMKGSKSQLEFLESRIRIAIRADENTRKLTVQDKNDIVTTDTRVVAARAKYLYAAAVYDLTKTVLSTAQRDWDTVSRRITQRGQDIERMKRENNVAGQTRPGRFNRPNRPVGDGLGPHQ